MLKQNKTIILASASPRRKILLKSMGIKFKAIPADVKENLSSSKLSPSRLAVNLALKKANYIFKKNKNSKKIKNSIIIGADTIIVLGKKILGKPKNKKDAFRILSLLSGKKHLVITGLALIDTGSSKFISGFAKSTVWFKILSPQIINEYIKTSEPADKAGAYALQGKGRLLISKISGPEDNIIGLPREKLKNMLSKFIN
ncbi:MAG: Maf family protein [bacterium]|nr:Maf family protein [bacterium]